MDGGAKSCHARSLVTLNFNIYSYVEKRTAAQKPQGGKKRRRRRDDGREGMKGRRRQYNPSLIITINRLRPIIISRRRRNKRVHEK